MVHVLENPVRAGLVKSSLEYRWLWREPQTYAETAWQRGRVAQATHTSDRCCGPGVLLCFAKPMKSSTAPALSPLMQRAGACQREPKSVACSSVPVNQCSRRAHELDDRMGRRFPAVRTRGPGRAILHVDGLRYIDFCLGDTGAMTDIHLRDGESCRRTNEARITMLPETRFLSRRNYSSASVCPGNSRHRH